MMIRHKGIEHTVYGEAPFLAARICAIGCSRGCPGCHNEHLKNDDSLIRIQEVQEIVEEVRSNFFNEGLVLGGLEWTEQVEEMQALIIACQVAGLEVMVYTGMTEEQFKELEVVGEFWVKYGSYQEGSQPHEMFGVKLASSNQIIKKYSHNTL